MRNFYNDDNNLSFTEILLDTLVHGTIHDLVKAISEELDSPVMLTDASYRLITYYPDTPIDDPLWNAIVEEGITPPDYVNKLHIDNIMRLGVNNNEPYFINWGFLQGHPRLLKNLATGNKSYGAITILCNDDSENMKRMIDYIGQVCLLAVQRNNVDESVAPDYQAMFLKALLDDEGRHPEQIYRWVRYLPIPLSGPYYICFCSCTAKVRSERLHTFISELTSNSYSNVLLLRQENEFVLLFTNVKVLKNINSFITRIHTRFSNEKNIFRNQQRIF